MERERPITRYQNQVSSGSLNAQNTFTTSVRIFGDFNFSLSGTWVGTVFIQRSFDLGATWVDVASYTANIEDAGYEAEVGTMYRAGFKTAGYTSGTAVMRISQ